MIHNLITKILANCTADDTVVHIAPLMPEDTAPYPDCAGRLILTNPDGDIVKALREDLEERDNVTILPIAVLPEKAQPLLNRYTLAEFNSFKQPTGLLDVYPGLQREDAVPVSMRTAAEFSKSLPATVSDSDVLIIQAVGEEVDILSGLTHAQGLERFAQVVLTLGKKPLFDGTFDVVTMATWLSKRGFDDFDEVLTDDPEIVILHAKRNPLRRPLNAALARLSNLEKDTEIKLEENGLEIESLQESLSRALQDMTDMGAQLDQSGAQIASLQADVDQTQAKLAQEAARAKTLADEKRDAAQQAAALRETHALLQKDHAALQADANTVAAQVTDLTAARDAYAKEAALVPALQAAASKAEAQLAQQAARIATLADEKRDVAQQAAALRETHQQLTQTNAALKADTATTKAKLDEQAARIATLADEKRDAAQQVTALRETHQQLTQTNAALKADLTRLQTQTTTDAKTITELRQSRAADAAAMAALKAELDALKATQAAETEAASHLLQCREEMAGASAQIALIQDLLLRGDQL